MKVVIGAHDFFPNTVGGVATTTGQLAGAFVALGHDVSVVALTPGPPQTAPYKVYRRPRPPTQMRLYRQADVLITTNLAIKLIYPLLAHQRPFALQHHSESAFRLSRSPLSSDALRRAVLPMARHFMTSEYIGRRSGLSDYVVTPPFADLSLIRSAAPPPRAERRGAVYVGRLEPEKGVRWLLQRWPMVRNLLGVSELRLVGSGSLTDSIKAEIAAGQLDGVTLMGPLNRSDVAQELRRAAFSFVPSLWNEPFGATALESIAAGALTILTDRGGLPEAGGSCGFYFNPDAPDAFEKALAAAREAHSNYSRNAAALTTYEMAVNEHAARFQPSRVAQTIIREMTSPQIAESASTWQKQSA
jgi:glycogen synthase